MTEIHPVALILEDDPVAAKVLAAVLKSVLIRTEITMSGKEFTESFKRIKPDICFIDLNFEELATGFHLIEALRRSQHKDLVIFVASGSRDRPSIVHAIELGANDYIVKPIDRHILLKKLSRFFQTTELSWVEGELLPLSSGELDVNLSLDFDIEEIDESGMILSGKNYISKGSNVCLGGDFVSSISGGRKSVNATVLSNSLDVETRAFRAKVEFEKTDLELLGSVRKWIMSRQKLPLKT